jgi:outer membrane protein TolC
VRRFLLIALLAAAPPLAGQEKATEQVLTLEQSVQRALQNNQRLLVAQDDIRIGEQRVREAQSQYFPQLGLNANASRYLAEQPYVLPPEWGGTLLRTSLESDSFYSGRVYLRQALYNGGRTSNTIRLSQTNLERARIQYDEIRNQVILDAESVFYDVLLLDRTIGLYEAALRSVETAAGQVAAGDVRRASEVRSIQNRLRRGLADKKLAANRARLEYLSVLGLELYTAVSLQGELVAKDADLDLAKLLARAQESRSDIRRTDFQREIDRLSVNLSLSERYPVVSLGAAYELNDPDTSLDTTQWNATLNVSLPIFDGFSSRARIRQRRIQVNQSRVRRTEIEDRVNLEVRESYADLAHWQRERVDREEELRRAAELAAQARAARDPLESARAEAWRLEAEEAYWEAVHAQIVAHAKLEKAVGRDLAD